ncbi:MAG: ATP-dependent DNA helicase PcrA [Candidatus Kerfeldbacteria bacterium CG_4_10_14_0_8_um_filter_42_10]|uniref:DNA 3'-5' helicase n=1 Tax=Candidatus Kerfeldbacteria bacterium CG_4_10_14_0_8_um_filter_42_10 TaxID=2014248 RepID=A0A2M7RJ30_9BACT|nr:MAG: ATP-dependent DNA helicase PcrA [Candidatus Kerfeldbacteria bacterium CG_4_10_14_0_8_um_filter_42_10]
MPDQILKDLNEKQKEAVLQTEGPVLILAGAGSGKTKILVHRIAHLILEKRINPAFVLAVTFTNKAAGEMKQRVEILLKRKFNASQSIDLNQPWIGTFHSFCVRILRKEIGMLGFKNNFLIYDDYDQTVLMKGALKKLGIDQKQYSPRLFSSIISNQAKNKLITPRQYQNQAKDFMEKLTAKVYQEYQKQLKEHNALDFDDLIMMTVQLFEKYPGVLEKYQRRFQYLMVDEYQDTNYAQYRLTNLLAKKFQNICVVGDDWQGIYSFRGADIQNILDFEKDYPRAKIIYLEQNYRSTKTIVEASNHIISKNKSRTEKKLWTNGQKGENITIQQVNDEQEEGEYILKTIFGIAQQKTGHGQTTAGEEICYESEEENEHPTRGILDTILELKKNNPGQKQIKTAKATIQKKIKAGLVDLSDYVVLYRTNAQSRALEETLMEFGVPYQIIGSVKFYERKEIKDLLAYLRILVEPNDKISVKRIINEPPRSIGGKTWSLLEDFAEISKIDCLKATAQPEKIASLPARAQNALAYFGNLILELQNKSQNLKPREIIDLILNKTGYKKYIQDGTPEGEARWENILELKTVARKFDNQKGLESIRSFLEEIALVNDVDFLENGKRGLTLMTTHNAKGLEYQVVFLAGMEEGLLPHANSLFDPAELEEERRLCYVGITRAKRKVHLIYTRQRSIWGTSRITIPSRFIDELPEELIDHRQVYSVT